MQIRVKPLKNTRRNSKRKQLKFDVETEGNAGGITGLRWAWRQTLSHQWQTLSDMGVL
jgi:hypothetical protein